MARAAYRAALAILAPFPGGAPGGSKPASPTRRALLFTRLPRAPIFSEAAPGPIHLVTPPRTKKPGGERRGRRRLQPVREPLLVGLDPGAVRVIPFTRLGWARPVRSEESNDREQRCSAKRAGLETRPRRAGGNSSRCAGDTGSDTGRCSGDTGGDAGRPGCNAGCSGVGLGGGCCSRLRVPCCRHPSGYCNSPVEQPQPLRTEVKRAEATKGPGPDKATISGYWILPKMRTSRSVS